MSENSSSYYVVTMVFHDQSIDIQEQISRFKKSKRNIVADGKYYIKQ